MSPPLFLLFLGLIPVAVLGGGCPHMMGQKTSAERERLLKERIAMAQAEGAPPATAPEVMDDNAPGTVPEEHSIQTTFIHHSRTADERKYAALVAAKLRDIRERLRRDVRVTVDNENIACIGTPDDHFRCSDYVIDTPYHFLVVEDSAKGAAVYSIERDLNGESAGKIEAALLDVLSRHSPHQLTLFASREAEKEVGFARELSVAELVHLQKPKAKGNKPVTILRTSPLEVNLLEPAMLELRNTEGLENVEHKLTIISTEEVFEEMLKRYDYVFVLFWTNVRSSSVHSFHLFAQTSNLIEKTADMQLAVVNCHEVDFCIGLSQKDFHTVVAYQKGEKVATQENMRDEQYYKEWVDLVIAGPLIKLQTAEEIKDAKKGYLLGDHRSAVTIGTFPNTEDTSFKHYLKMADKFNGRYYLAYVIKENASPSLISYRPNEKKKRVDYSGKFDPATVASFISYSTFPTIADITEGFSTDLLFYQPLPVIVLVAPADFDTSNFQTLAGKTDFAGKKYIFARIISDKCTVLKDVLSPLNLVDFKDPIVVVFNKHKVYQLEVLSSNTDEELLEWLKHTEEAEADYTITYKDIHPLFHLQLEKSNQVFGHQPVTLLPDLSIFANKAVKPPMPLLYEGGGCPFMNHGGAAGGGLTKEEGHDEL